MPRFVFMKDTVWRGKKRLAGEEVTVSKGLLRLEENLGKHKKTGRPVSPLLNHAESLPEPKKGNGKAQAKGA